MKVKEYASKQPKPNPVLSPDPPEDVFPGTPPRKGPKSSWESNTGSDADKSTDKNNGAPSGGTRSSADKNGNFSR